MNRNYFIKKRVIILTLLNLFIIFSSFSQKVVLNILDKTRGKALLTFSKDSKINDYEFSREETLGERKKLTDSTFQVIFNLSRSNSIITCACFYDKNLILLTAGDSLNAVIDYSDKDKKFINIIFKGKNENNYNSNIARKIYENNRNIISRINKTTNLQESFKIIDSIYLSNTSVLKNAPVSVYKEMKINEEKANYFYYLYFALNDSNKIIQHSEILKLKDKIFSKKIECQLPLLMEVQYYKSGMYYLYKLLCQNIKSDNTLMASTDTINKYFTGELRDFLLTTNFHSIYFSNQKENKKDPDIEIWFKTYKNKMQEPVYNDYILYTYNQYGKLNAPFPSDILNEKIISLKDSSEISIGDLLSKYKGNPIIIDHWATWCGACVQEIIEGENNTEKLETKGVQFIYLSLDNMQNFNKAKQKSIDLKINDKAYILSGNFETKYIKYLNISFIPRYTLIDTSGNVRNTNLNRPRDIFDYDKYIK